MTKMQKYDALLARAWIFSAMGIALAIVAVVFATATGCVSQTTLACWPAWIAWTAVAFGFGAIVLCLVGICYKVASVKLMRRIVDER